MPKVVISAIGAVVNAGDHSVVSDHVVLASMHGMHSDLTCDEFLTESLQELGISGGRLRFVCEGDAFRITTAYDVSKTLREIEQEQLIEDTIAQWAEGIGVGQFGCYRGDVLSIQLARAVQALSPASLDLGEYYVDAFPDIEDRELRVVFHEHGFADDELVEELKAAVADNDSAAMIELGQMFEHGEGVAVDHTAAFQLYERAYQDDHVMGALCLGICFLRGQGTAIDEERAVDLLQSSADEGEPLAWELLGTCYEKGQGVHRDPEQAVECYRQGAELEDGACLARLGNCYEFGVGVEQDLSRARTLYEDALDTGYDDAGEALQRILSQT